jgi:hypothetical protein
MKPLLLLAILAGPAAIGSIAVLRMEGPVGFVIALICSLIMLRDAILICMMLMRHWQLFGRDLFLVEENGRHRWVDVFELTAMPKPCRVRARRFRPDFMRRHREQ